MAIVIYSVSDNEGYDINVTTYNKFMRIALECGKIFVQAEL